jgi:hypothetical protein
MAPRCGVMGCSSPSGQTTQRKITGSPVRRQRRPCIHMSARVRGHLCAVPMLERVPIAERRTGVRRAAVHPWSVPSNGRPWRRPRLPIRAVISSARIFRGGWINGCGLGSTIWTVEHAAALHSNEVVDDYAVECSARLT